MDYTACTQELACSAGCSERIHGAVVLSSESALHAKDAPTDTQCCDAVIQAWLGLAKGGVQVWWAGCARARRMTVTGLQAQLRARGAAQRFRTFVGAGVGGDRAG